MIYTVFPDDTDRMPQDFETYEEAKEYGDENEPEDPLNQQPGI